MRRGIEADGRWAEGRGAQHLRAGARAQGVQRQRYGSAPPKEHRAWALNYPPWSTTPTRPTPRTTCARCRIRARATPTTGACVRRAPIRRCCARTAPSAAAIRDQHLPAGLGARRQHDLGHRGRGRLASSRRRLQGRRFGIGNDQGGGRHLTADDQLQGLSRLGQRGPACVRSGGVRPTRPARRSRSPRARTTERAAERTAGATSTPESWATVGAVPTRTRKTSPRLDVTIDSGLQHPDRVQGRRPRGPTHLHRRTNTRPDDW